MRLPLWPRLLGRALARNVWRFLLCFTCAFLDAIHDDAAARGLWGIAIRACLAFCVACVLVDVGFGGGQQRAVFCARQKWLRSRELERASRWKWLMQKGATTDL